MTSVVCQAVTVHHALQAIELQYIPEFTAFLCIRPSAEVLQIKKKNFYKSFLYSFRFEKIAIEELFN